MGRKFTIFALFYFVFKGKFQVQAPQGAYILRGDLTEGFLRYDFRALIFGGAYTRRGLCSLIDYNKYLLEIFFLRDCLSPKELLLCPGRAVVWSL